MNLSLEEQQEFKQEANELIECMESNFLELEMGADLGPRYDEIFRSLHNLKGTASMMNFTSLKDLVHEMETSFTSYKGQEKIDEEVLARLIQEMLKERHIRMWSAACSTGQEAFSMCIAGLEEEASFSILA